MSLSPPHYKQQSQQQQQAARRLRPTSTTAHDAAAALYDEMSYAAACTSNNISAELRQASPPSHLGLSPVVSGITAATLARQASAVSFSGVPSDATSPSNSLTTMTMTTTTNAAATAASVSSHPLFYVHRLSSSRGGRGGGRFAGVGGTATTPGEMQGGSGGGLSVIRGTSASVTAAVSPQLGASSISSLGTNPNNPMSSLSTPPSNTRGGSLTSTPLNSAVAAACSNNVNNNSSSSGGVTAPVYIRHTAASMSAAAPWLRLHRYGGGNAGSSIVAANVGGATNFTSGVNSSINANNSTSGMGLGSPSASSASTRKASNAITGPLGSAPSATGGSGGTPKAANALSSPTPTIADTPPASLDSAYNPNSEDEVTLVCQLCQRLNCVCGCGGGTGEGGCGGGTGEGGFGGLGSHAGGYGSGSGDGSRTPWSTVMALQQQPLLRHHTPSPAAAVAAIVPLSLVPPFRTARVESGVYRGAYPVLRNFPYLRRLRLRTIVSLIPEPPTYDLRCFAEAEHIQLHHIHAERAKGEVQLLPSELSEALQLIMNVDLHPLYVHCLDGRHVTGLVIMGVRKLQLWDIKAAHAEYLRFTGEEEQDEVAFIADYTGPLLVPPHIPPWLWDGSLYDSATGQPKKLQPSTMRFRLSTAVAGGMAPPPSASGGINAGVSNSGNPSTATDGVARAYGSGHLTTRSSSMSIATTDANDAGGAGARDSGVGTHLQTGAAVPWMSVPYAEVMASDGQLYVDVDRVQGTAALYSSSSTSASYSNVPMLFSFEYAAAAKGGAAAGGGGGTSASCPRTRRGQKSSPYSASATTPFQLPNNNNNTNNNTTMSRHSTPPSSANGSMAGSGSAANTRSSSPSSKWVTMTGPLSTLQPHLNPNLMPSQPPPSPNPSGAPAIASTTTTTASSPLAVAPATSGGGGAGGSNAALSLSLQRASPTPSNGSSNANDGAGATNSSSSLFDNQLSSLMWTSGLTTTPSGPPVRRNSTLASMGALTAGGVGVGGAGGVGVGGASGNGGGGGSGVGGPTAAAGAAATSSGARRAAGTSGTATGSSATSRAVKRSFSR